MASSNSYLNHKAQVSHNERFVSLLSPPTTQYPDWVATGAFYMALHCVDANAAKIGLAWRDFPPELSPTERRKISRHTKRVRYVRRYHRELFNDYNHLLTESLNARYDPIYLKNVKPTTPSTIFLVALRFKKIV